MEERDKICEKLLKIQSELKAPKNNIIAMVVSIIEVVKIFMKH